MSYRHIKKLEQHLHLGVLGIELHRPESRNAFSLTMITELVELLQRAELDDGVRVLYLQGAGDSFCAGGDLKEMAQKAGMFAGEPNELRVRYQRGIQQIPLAIAALSKPLIGKINGPAIGAGCDLAAMCDIRMGTTKSKFGETFCKLALVPGDGGTWFLPRVVGYAKALEMFLTGDIYNAQQAYEMGLLNHVVQKEDLDKDTLALCLKIAGNSPIALSLTKKALQQSQKNDLPAHLDLLAAYQGITQRTQDHFEGLDALRTGRPPQFSGF